LLARGVKLETRIQFQHVFSILCLK
jgi:hypothetical protein